MLRILVIVLCIGMARWIAQYTGDVLDFLVIMGVEIRLSAVLGFALGLYIANRVK